MSCAHFEKDIISKISDDINREFEYKVLIIECTLDLSTYYNPGRRQYDANRILEKISKISPQGSIKTMGLFGVDLFIPILTYIFGQAILCGETAIASFYRLRNELYGLEKNNEILIERFRKVIMHELGHTFGLIHCKNPICIMRSSTYVEDIDQKKLHFCHHCKIALNRHRNWINKTANNNKI